MSASNLNSGIFDHTAGSTRHAYDRHQGNRAGFPCRPTNTSDVI